MPVRFRVLTEADVKAVLTMDDLIETMTFALESFSSKRVEQPVRSMIPVDGNHALFATMPAFVRAPGSDAGPTRAAARAALGAKLVTVYEANHAKGLPSHLASIVLLDPETGALRALLDGRYITEARTAAVSAVSSRLLARKTSKSLAIIGSGVQAKSHLEALSRIHQLKQVTVWSPSKNHRERFVAEAKTATGVGHGSDTGRTRVRPVSDTAGSSAAATTISCVDHAGEAVVGADVIVLVTSSSTPVLESGWVKPGAHVISVGACRPNQREMDPALTARAKLFVDSREAALVESGDVVMGIQDGRFGPQHIRGELGQLIAGTVPGRTSDMDITIFKSLGMAVEDVTAAALAYQRAVEKGLGAVMEL